MSILNWSIEQTVAPTREPLDVDTVCQHLRVVDLDEEIPYIQSLIRTARHSYERDTRTQLIQAQYRYNLDYFDTFEIQLPKPPLVSIDSIEYFDTEGVQQTFDSADYETKSDRKMALVRPVDGETWPDTDARYNAAWINYTSGYATAPSGVPDDAKHAMLLLIGHWYRVRETSVERMLHDTPLGYKSLVLANRRHRRQ